MAIFYTYPGGGYALGMCSSIYCDMQITNKKQRN